MEPKYNHYSSKNIEKKEEHKWQLKFLHPEITVALLQQLGV